MLIFAHTGITLGTAMLLQKGLCLTSPIFHCQPASLPNQFAASRIPACDCKELPLCHCDCKELPPCHCEPEQSEGVANPTNPSPSAARPSSLPIDYRFILLGSLLPDFIDKPLGFLLHLSGRMIAHSLLFLLILTIAGFWLYRSRGKPWLLFLAFGSLMHLILDQMWLAPQILLYPLYGWAFPATDLNLSNWLETMAYELFTNPAVYIPELIGVIILAWFAASLIRNKQVYAFIETAEKEVQETS